MTMHADERYARLPRGVEFPSGAEVPESKRHLELRTTLYLILKIAFQDRAMIGSDQFVYWDATDPSACLAPDVFVRWGAPDENFNSWKTWERGVPHVAVEIVSRSDADADSWAEKLAKYRRLGIAELVRFDADDATSPLRVWDYLDGDLVERDIGASRIAECGPLAIWWTVREDDDLGLSLRLSRDAAGTELLSTALELRDAAELGRNSAERERDAALAEVRALKEELSKRR